MKATITVDMDNQAFEEDPGRELGRILLDLAERIPDRTLPLPAAMGLYDLNGNWTGKCEVTP